MDNELINTIMDTLSIFASKVVIKSWLADKIVQSFSLLV